MFIGAVAGVLLFIAPVSKSFLMFANGLQVGKCNFTDFKN